MLSNEYCRWYSFDNSEAVTTSGQLTIKFTERVINEYLNGKLGTVGIDRVIAIDTDSVYVDMSGIVKKLGISDKNETIDALDSFCRSELLPYLESCYSKLKERMNAYQQKMVMKRETIADRAVFRGKKMYVLNALDSEGVRFAEPKLVAHGIEAVRSSTPHACREKIKKAFELLLKGDRLAFDDLLSRFKIEFENASPEEIAFPRGVHGIRKYVDPRLVYASGTPLHVKGAIIYNAMIERLGLGEKEPIHDGDKIKYLYLNVPNPTGDKVISFKDELPKEFGLEEYIDRDLQFTKAFVEPIDSIASLVGWGVEAACDRRATLANLIALSQQGE
jgi:DNA polymerase elongation subunit (family B)